jgi:hypothetical protein
VRVVPWPSPDGKGEPLPQSLAMVRSLRLVVIGWSLGFVLAGLWGLTQPGDHRLASVLFVPAGIGVVGLGVVFVLRARRGDRWRELHGVAGPELSSAEDAPTWSWPETAPANASDPADPAAAVAAADAAAARIAELEARLALEQQELDQVIHALAETDPPALSDGAGATELEEVDATAAELEPLLRQEVLDTLVQLVGDKDVVREFESLTASREVAAPPAKRRAVSKQKGLQPAGRRRKPAKRKGAVDKRTERVGKRDLPRSRARNTQQVGRTDEDG